MMDGTDWIWGLVMMVFWAVILGTVITAAIHYLRNNSPQNNNQSSPTAIAKERYARGELTKEQFEELKRDLKE